MSEDLGTSVVNTAVLCFVNQHFLNLDQKIFFLLIPIGIPWYTFRGKFKLRNFKILIL